MNFLTQINFAKKSINKKEALKYAIIINVVMLIITFLIFTPTYETNDDIAMASFARGAYSEKSSYLVFINFILGWIFKMFYIICGSINWYYVLQCIFMLGAFIILSFLVYMSQSKAKYPIAQGTVMNVFLLILFIPIMYLNFNFTKSAAIVSIAGFLLLLHQMLNEHGEIHIILLGASFIILGGMIRLDSMLMVSIFPFFIIVYRLFKIKNKRIALDYRLFFKYTILFIPIFFISFGLSYLNTIKNPEYNAYNHARSQLIDFGVPDYDKNQKAYEHIGISKNDYVMLNSWTFDDPEFFTTEKFKEIMAIRKNEFDILKAFDDTFNTIARSILTIGSASLFVFIVSIWFLFLKKDKFIPITLSLAVLAFYFYLCVIGRVVDRVEQALWIAAVYTLIYNMKISITQIPVKSKKKMLIVTIVVALLWNGNSIWDNCIATTEKVHTSKYIQVADRLSEDKNNLYLIDTSTMDVIQGFVSPFRTIKEKFYSNLYTLGGWATKLPLKKESLDKYGISNPLKDSVNKDNIYFVDQGDFKYKYNYVREHYYSDLAYVKTKDLGVCQVYKLYQLGEQSISEKIEDINPKHIHFNNFMKIQDHEYLHLYGKLNVDGFDTFEQEIFVKAKNIDNGDVKLYQATTYVDDKNRSGGNVMSKNVLDNFKVDIPNYELSGEQMEFQFFLKYHNHYYNMKTMKLNLLKY